MIKIYGIKNCNSVKKALNYLEENKIKYDFHDYKKLGVTDEILNKFINKFTWENVVNSRGTTFRKLSENQRPTNAAQAIAVMKQNTSIIKRPILDDGKNQILGFDIEQYSKILGS